MEVRCDRGLVAGAGIDSGTRGQIGQVQSAHLGSQSSTRGQTRLAGSATADSAQINHWRSSRYVEEHVVKRGIKIDRESAAHHQFLVEVRVVRKANPGLELLKVVRSSS